MACTLSNLFVILRRNDREVGAFVIESAEPKSHESCGMAFYIVNRIRPEAISYIKEVNFTLAMLLWFI